MNWSKDVVDDVVCILGGILCPTGDERRKLAVAVLEMLRVRGDLKDPPKPKSIWWCEKHMSPQSGGDSESGHFCRTGSSQIGECEIHVYVRKI